MSLSPLAAAKSLCEYSDWKLTNLSVNKILYLTHMIYMGQSGGQRLIEGEFQAWTHGPVLPEVYEAFKPFGASNVKNLSFVHDHLAGEPLEIEWIKWGHKELKKYSPWELVSMTHADEGAWAEVYRPGMKGLVISDDAIMREYNARYA